MQMQVLHENKIIVASSDYSLIFSSIFKLSLKMIDMNEYITNLWDLLHRKRDLDYSERKEREFYFILFFHFGIER